MGTFTTKDRRMYQNICHLSDNAVLQLVKDILVSAKYQEVYACPAYVYAVGDIPVALVAHADTVFSQKPNLDSFFYDQERDVIWSYDGAGADDRAGIFAIIKILRTYKLKPHVIITTGEEIGCVGATKMIAQLPSFPAELKFIIQLDRRGHNDSVYYDCDNKEFEKFINEFGFKTALGTLSDISVLAPYWKVAAVNFSIGYEDEHQYIERLHVNWMYETIEKTANILKYVQEHSEVPVYEYIPTVYTGHYYGYDWYYDDELNYTYDGKRMYGHDKCLLCNHEEPISDMIPVWFEYGTAEYNLCLDCYAKYSDQIIWCKQCNKARFLTSDVADKIDDVNNWICGECKKNGKFTGTKGTVLQSTGVQSV